MTFPISLGLLFFLKQHDIKAGRWKLQGHGELFPILFTPPSSPTYPLLTLVNFIWALLQRRVLCMEQKWSQIQVKHAFLLLLGFFSLSLISCLKELRVDMNGQSSQMLALCFAPREELCLLENKNIVLASTHFNGLLSCKVVSLNFV